MFYSDLSGKYKKKLLADEILILLLILLLICIVYDFTVIFG